MIIGVDEVGRGPLFGSVVAAACVLPDDYSLDGLNDSKKINEKKRDLLADLIKEQALYWSIAEASVEEIDSLNILQASLLAMHRAVDEIVDKMNNTAPKDATSKGVISKEAISKRTFSKRAIPEEISLKESQSKQTVLKELVTNVLVDGNKLPSWQYPSKAIVGGDGKEPCISAASILAKVFRDQQMQALAKEFPQYGLESHKGYPTPQHLKALKQYGVTPLHRRSFSPVKMLLAESDLFAE